MALFHNTHATGKQGNSELIFPSLYLFLDITNRMAFSSLQLLYQNGNI